MASTNTGIPAPPNSMKLNNSIGAFTDYGMRTTPGASQSQAALPRRSQPQRKYSGPNFVDADVSSVQRAIIQPEAGSLRAGNNPTTRPSTIGDRRSSVYQSRQSLTAPVTRQSFFQTTPLTTGVPRDPRPLRDRAYQANIGQQLLNYMGKNKFEIETKHVLSQNAMTSPTQKDFNYIFQWLYHRIDPSYRFQRSIEQEVPPILKLLRYPFERSLTKSQIAAVGGQNWSSFLGLLHWMMQLAEMTDRYSRNQYDETCLDSGIDIISDHIIFDFLSCAYRDWLAMDEELGDEDADEVLAPHVEKMAVAFARSNSRYTTELEGLEAENSRLLMEIENLEKSTPDTTILDYHFKIMEEDRVNFETYNIIATHRSEKYEYRTAVVQEELEKLHAELCEAEEERRSLQQSVDAIGISLSDIDRMTTERERLQRGIESSSQRLDELKKRSSETEAEASRRLDELERMVAAYNTLTYNVAMSPAMAGNAKVRELELRLAISDNADCASDKLLGGGPGRLLADLNNGYQRSGILNLDLRGQMRSRFVQLRKEISERRNVMREEMLKDHELLDGINEAIENKRSEVAALEHRVRAAQEEHETTREVTTAQRMASEAQIEKMEKELSRIRTEGAESVQLLEQQEINIGIEYEQLILRTSSLRDELHTEIDRILNDVIKFKIHVQKHLDEYEGFVADELERELRDEMMEDG